jgi:DeoR/GlpR family transcriptional regulator of sugar metabolism
MVGGNFCPESASFTGQLAEENAKSFYYDVAVFSTKGVVTGEGTFESSPENFRVKQLVAPRATKVIVLADHSKFGVRALRKVLDFSAIHCVVTDDGTPMSAVKKMQACGVEVIVAGAKTPVACV